MLSLSYSDKATSPFSVALIGLAFESHMKGGARESWRKMTSNRSWARNAEMGVFNGAKWPTGQHCLYFSRLPHHCRGKYLTGSFSLMTLLYRKVSSRHFIVLLLKALATRINVFYIQSPTANCAVASYNPYEISSLVEILIFPASVPDPSHYGTDADLRICNLD